MEEAEKTKVSRLAREIIVALPVELSLEQNIQLIEDYVQTQFVSAGMCTDVCIHDTDGHNPHAHILLTIRPLKENGTWQPKTEKEYLCFRDGIEQGLTASEFLSAQKDGWEKQYLYSVGGDKKYLPPSQADGYERLSKHPKSSKLGRQNPITQQWNSRDQLVVWRKAWADEMNKHLERAGHSVRVDHRSFKAQGIDRQPTIHEGVFAIRMERKGRKSDRREINRTIFKDNSALAYWAEAVINLTKALVLLIPVIAYIDVFAFINIEEMAGTPIDVGSAFQLYALINPDNEEDLFIVITGNSTGEIYRYDHTSIPHETTDNDKSENNTSSILESEDDDYGQELCVQRRSHDGLGKAGNAGSVAAGVG